MNAKMRMLIVAAIAAASACAAPHARPPDVKLDNPPALEDAGSFSMVLFGDPQTYVKNTFSQPIFELMTAWTAAHRDALKIRAVLCTGDLVERNDTPTAFPQTRDDPNGNAPSFEQWEFVARAFSRLDGKIPYVLCTGNHDCGYESAENRRTKFGGYFPASKNPLWRDCLAAVFPNAEGEMTLENAAFEFSDGNWGQILVVALEFAPRDEVLEWACNLLKSEKFKNRRAIILAHSVLGAKKGSAKIIESEPYGLRPRNWGAGVMKKLAHDSDNIMLVVCGHSGDPSRMAAMVEYENAKGAKIPVVMFNPQAVGGWNGNGGDGWLRIMEFMPDGKTVSMRTYSPLFAASEKTQSLSWNRDADNEFRLTLR